MKRVTVIQMTEQ